MYNNESDFTNEVIRKKKEIEKQFLSSVSIPDKILFDETTRIENRMKDSKGFKPGMIYVDEYGVEFPGQIKEVTDNDIEQMSDKNSSRSN